jgi:putative spermidine/putrescine transport system permease protein
MTAISPVESQVVETRSSTTPLRRTGGPFARMAGNRPATWRWLIILAVGAIYVVPVLSSVKFSFQSHSGAYNLSNYKAIVDSGAVRSSALLSLEIAVIVAAASVLLMLPTVILVRLRFPRLTFLMEVITILPIVVPPIVLTAGLQQMQESAPLWIVNLLFNHDITALVPFYLIFTLPLMYRALDTGVRAIDLHTLVDASRSLGSGWVSTIFRVILPNVQTALLGGAFLSIALCLGEVVLANGLDLPQNTFPLEMIQFAQQDNAPGVAVAMTLIAFLFTFLLLFLMTFLVRRRGVRSTGVI